MTIKTATYALMWRVSRRYLTKLLPFQSEGVPGRLPGSWHEAETVKVLTIHCEWDDEAGVWYVSESDVPGLAGEAPTIEDMDRLLRQRIPELISLNMPDLDFRADREVPWDLVARRHSRISLAD